MSFMKINDYDEYADTTVQENSNLNSKAITFEQSGTQGLKSVEVEEDCNY